MNSFRILYINAPTTFKERIKSLSDKTLFRKQTQDFHSTRAREKMRHLRKQEREMTLSNVLNGLSCFM